MADCTFKIKTDNGITPELTLLQLHAILRTIHMDSDNVNELITKMTQQKGVKYQLSQEDVQDKLQNLFKSEKTKIKNLKDQLADESLLLDGAITATQLVEIEHKNLRSFASATNMDDYINAEISRIQEEKAAKGETITQDDKDKIHKQAFMWTQTAKDGGLLHGYAPIAYLHSLSDNTNYSAYQNDLKTQTEESTEEPKESLFKLLAGRFIDTQTAINQIDQCMKSVNHIINSQLQGVGNAQKRVIVGQHLSAELLEDVIEGVKRVGARFDRIYIDGFGRVHVFNFKFSQSESKDWAIAKKEKYQLELAVIKEILKQHGIDVTGASFYDIPIHVIYEGEPTYNGTQYIPPKIKKLQAEGDSLISGNISNSGTSSPMAKNEEKLQRLFPKVEANTQKLDSIDFDFNIDNATALIQAVNPEFNAERSGIQISARAYIKAEKNKSINLSEDGTHWVIIFPNGNKIETSTLREEELFSVVNEHIEDLSIKLPIVTSELVKSVENAYARGSAQFERFGFKNNSQFIQERLSKYFMRDSNEKPIWQPLLHNQLAQVGIFLFKNTITGTIDVVKFSALKLQEKIPTTHKFQDNILGYYEMDMENVTYLKSSYGDMELLFTTAILNELVTGNKLEKPVFGAIKIISPYYRGEANYQDSDFAIKEFGKITSYLNKREDIGHKFVNNFNQNNIADPLVSIIEEIEAIKSYTDINKSLLEGMNSAIDLSMLKNAKTEAARVQGMLQIKTYIESKWGEDPDKILDKLHSPNRATRILAQIYLDACVYYSKYIGLGKVQVKYFNTFKRQVIRTDSHPDENFRLIGNLYARELDALAFDFQKLYAPIRNDFLKFYETKGLSSSEQFFVGSAKGLYSKMFRRDPQNQKMLWQFVNPYDEAQCKEYQLDKDEIAILKKSLFHINKTRARAKGKEFNFTSVEDPALKTYIKENSNTYFLVPLLKRSTNIKENAIDWINNKKRLFKKLETSENINETLRELFQPTDRRMIDDANKEESIYDLTVSNKLIMSEDPEGREVLLAQHDDNYFETNIEYIVNEYLFAALNYEHMKAMELKGKAILFRLHLQARESGPRQARIIEDSIKAGEDFLKLNVYNKSLMSESGQKLANMMKPAKRIMSNLLIMGNLRAAFRDSFEGLMQNTVRTLTKFNTNLMTSNVYKAYGVVLKDIFSNDRTLNIVSELCLRYRLSNTDAAKVNERSKFGKGGITNPSYLGYSTLRGPDFLNRMTLFVARCLQDGTFGAYDLNDQNELVYYAARDERFKIFFEGLTEHPKYKESKAAYFSAVREWNENHNEEDRISYDISQDQLPEPYSYKDIESFKEFSNMIYAAYDTYAKAGYEQLALGQTLGVFSTWFNGITAAWLRERGEYESQFRIRDENGNLLIKHNAAGNELYFNDYGNILEKRKDGTYWDDHNQQVEVDEKTLVPVIDKVPVMIQGIINTFKDVWAVVSAGNIRENWYSKVWKYESNRANIYRVLSDLIMMILFGIIFGNVFFEGIAEKKYNEHKKEKEADNLALDLGLELLYKGTYNSFDGFFGPITVAQYILNDMDPSAAKLNLQLINQGVNTLRGQQSVGKFFYSNMPIFRTFKDTIKMYSPESFKANTSN